MPAHCACAAASAHLTRTATRRAAHHHVRRAELTHTLLVAKHLPNGKSAGPDALPNEFYGSVTQPSEVAIKWHRRGS